MADRGKFDELIKMAQQKAAAEERNKKILDSSLKAQLQMRKHREIAKVQSQIKAVLGKVDIPGNLQLFNERSWQGLGSIFPHFQKSYYRTRTSQFIPLLTHTYTPLRLNR